MLETFFAFKEKVDKKENSYDYMLSKKMIKLDTLELGQVKNLYLLNIYYIVDSLSSMFLYCWSQTQIKIEGWY